MSQQGQYQQADFFDNTGGLNLSDSPFRVQDTQATGGQNFEYDLTGGIKKIKGATKVNNAADSAVRTVGLAQHVTTSGTKTNIRCADRKVQAVDLTTPSFTNLTEDTVAASSDILANSNTVPVVFSQFNTSTVNTLWMAGGGMSLPYAVYSSTKVTKNGVPEPGGSISLSAGGAGGSFVSTGYYRYAIAFHKASTGAVSNAVLFKEVNVTATTQKVTIDLSSVTGGDTTKYDTYYIYRSAVSATAQGNVAFTTGDYVGSTATSNTSYVDSGTYTSTAQNVPQANSTILDNSVLPSGTYNVITTWKRRLVTASGSTLYISDTNKPESWPTVNYIQVPSGGPITALSVISFTTPTSTSIEEILVIFKERELWVLSGSTYTDFSLKFIDSVGCVAQPLIAYANGYLSWIDYRGIYLWDGSGKPIYCSRTIEPLFQFDGNIDKTKLGYSHCVYRRNSSQIIWYLSSQVEGEQKFAVKMDLRLTIPQVQTNLGGRVIDAVLVTDTLDNYALYASSSIVVSGDETILCGDASGYLYKLYDSLDDAGADINFGYETKFFDLGMPNTTKRFHKLIVWVEDSTDADLTLEYWTNYFSGADDSSVQKARISSQVRESLWDLGYWDATYWDSAQRGFNPVVFNIQSSKNASEGDCIKLKFSQPDADAPCTIAGFSIIYSIAGMRK